MLKLVLVTHYFPSYGGGIETAAGHIADKLAAKQFAEIIWCASDVSLPGLERSRISYEPMKTFNGTDGWWGIPYPIWHWSALKKLAGVIRSSHAVHVHEFFYFGSFAAFLLAVRYRKPVVLTQHIGDLPYQNPLVRSFFSLLNRGISRIIFRRMAGVIFESERVRQYFLGHARFQSPPALIPNGVDHDIFSPASFTDRLQIRGQLGLRPDQPVFLFVARFVEKKGIRIIRQLAARMPDSQWVLVGWGPEDPTAWGLSNVRVYNDLRGKNLVPFYQMSDLFILPSIGEGFPLAVQEAMACGLPVLTGPETAEADPDLRDVLFSESVKGADAVVRWEKRIEAIVASGILEPRREEIHAFARARWDWGRCADSYADLLQQILSLSHA